MLCEIVVGKTIRGSCFHFYLAASPRLLSLGDVLHEQRAATSRGALSYPIVPQQA